MLKQYRTPKALAEAELTEKKSRFIAAVCPVSTEEEALEFVRARRALFPDARHHVFAYDVHTSDGTYSRYSDDGEPQGTGGLPVMDVIAKRGLVNACVVVTRYFGGTLLGAAGLVRAYSGSAALCLDAAGIAEIRYCRRFDVAVSYTDSGRVRNWLEAEGAAGNAVGARRDGAPLPGLILLNTEYGAEVCFRLSVPEDNIDRVLAALTELTSSRMALSEGPFEYRPIQ